MRKVELNMHQNDCYELINNFPTQRAIGWRSLHRWVNRYRSKGKATSFTKTTIICRRPPFHLCSKKLCLLITHKQCLKVNTNTNLIFFCLSCLSSKIFKISTKSELLWEALTNEMISPFIRSITAISDNVSKR